MEQLQVIQKIKCERCFQHWQAQWKKYECAEEA
jgi:hypothetical protein